MVNKFFRWSAIVVSVSALWVGTALMAPKALAADACGGPGESVCRSTDYCFFTYGRLKVCNTITDYWQTGDEVIEEPKQLEEPEESDGPEELLEDG